MPVVIHEFVTYAVSDHERHPWPLNKRAKIWRALMPPDQLNPQGWIYAAIDSFMPTQVSKVGLFMLANTLGQPAVVCPLHTTAYPEDLIQDEESFFEPANFLQQYTVQLETGRVAAVRRPYLFCGTRTVIDVADWAR